MILKDSQEEIISCIKEYRAYKQSSSYPEQYKWDFIKKHAGIFDSLDHLLDKFTSLGSENFFPYVWKQSMFRELALHHEEALKRILEELFNDKEDIEKRATNFIDSISRILNEDSRWKNKSYLTISALLEVVSFLLFLKSPRDNFFFVKIEVLKKFVLHFNLDNSLVDSAHKVHRYVLWQKFTREELLPILKDNLDKNADLLDCQDFIYCLAQHNICNWNYEADKAAHSQNKNALKKQISPEEAQAKMNILLEQGIKF
jgi:hypothetical protein